jgi:hypothetical protein
LLLSVNFLVTASTESDQVFLSIVAQLAPWLNVMDLKIFHPPTRLATPSISLKDLAAELAISLGIKPQPWPLC